jgi:hypothetical protein
VSAAKPLTVEQAKREILRRIAKATTQSVSSKVRLGPTPPHVIDAAFYALRDEGQVFCMAKRWYMRPSAVARSA